MPVVCDDCFENLKVVRRVCSKERPHVLQAAQLWRNDSPSPDAAAIIPMYLTWRYRVVFFDGFGLALI